MTPRRAVLGGLLAGVLAGAALLVAVVALLPVEEPVSMPGAPAGSAPLDTSPSGPSSSAPSGPSASASASASASTSGSPAPTDSSIAETFMVGERAPALTLPQLGGGTVDLAALRGRPVWLTFMATWCPSCRQELPRMALAAARYANNGLVVFAIDVAEDEATVAAYLSSLGLDLPVALDADGATMRRWRVLVLPVHFWIDHDGVIRFGALGGVGPDVFAEALRTILPGVTVEP